MRPLIFVVAIALVATHGVPAHVYAETESHGSVNNHPPKVIQVEGLPEQVVPIAGGQRAITFSFMARDPNGWQDIVRAEVALYAPDNTTFMREANVTGVTGGNGASHWFNATFTMWYYELPTHGQNYTLQIRVLDQTGMWSAPKYAEFQYAELSAIQIVTTTAGSGTQLDAHQDNGTADNGTAEPALGFEGATPGSSSQNTEAVIRNTGNVVVDIELYGTDLVDGNGHSIPVSAVRYDPFAPDMANEAPLTRDPLALASFDLAPGADSERSIWWRLVVPTGDEQYIPAGTYSGSVTMTALAS